MRFQVKYHKLLKAYAIHDTKTKRVYPFANTIEKVKEIAGRVNKHPNDINSYTYLPWADYKTLESIERLNITIKQFLNLRMV